jgi:hypothetical protein
LFVRQPAHRTSPIAATTRKAIEQDGLIALGECGYLHADGCRSARSCEIVISGDINIIYMAEIDHTTLRWPANPREPKHDNATTR